MRTKWEYKYVTVPQPTLPLELTKLGEEYWELVHVSYSQSHGLMPDATLILKRPFPTPKKPIITG